MSGCKRPQPLLQSRMVEQLRKAKARKFLVPRACQFRRVGTVNLCLNRRRRWQNGESEKKGRQCNAAADALHGESIGQARSRAGPRLQIK